MFRGVVYVVGHSACEKRLLAFRSGPVRSPVVACARRRATRRAEDG